MDELRHYGINGQKWGIRRWQNPDGSFNEEGKKRYGRLGRPRVNKELARKISKERSSLINKYVEEDPRLAKSMKLREEALALAEKYHLDLDDGGGGDGTPEAIKAGRKYMKMWDTIDKLEDGVYDKVYHEAKQRAQEYMNNKYGKDVMTAYQRRNNVIGNAVSIGVSLAAIGGLVLTTKAVNKLANKGMEFAFKGLGYGMVGAYNLVTGKHIKMK